MTVILTNEEKTGIIHQHLRNLEYNKFNLEMTLVEENAKTSPDSKELTSLNSQISDIVVKIEALNLELDKLV